MGAQISPMGKGPLSTGEKVSCVRNRALFYLFGVISPKLCWRWL